jgi:hypothetical protein
MKIQGLAMYDMDKFNETYKSGFERENYMQAEERLAAFERMMKKIQNDSITEKEIMDKLKSQGREKTATYRQYMGNRLMYNRMLSLYREYGLLE